jgi:hypothetical protein
MVGSTPPDEKTPFQLLVLVGGIARFGLVLWVVVDWYIAPDTLRKRRTSYKRRAWLLAIPVARALPEVRWCGPSALPQTEERTARRLKGGTRGLQK